MVAILRLIGTKSHRHQIEHETKMLSIVFGMNFRAIKWKIAGCQLRLIEILKLSLDPAKPLEILIKTITISRTELFLQLRASSRTKSKTLRRVS